MGVHLYRTVNFFRVNHRLIDRKSPKQSFSMADGCGNCYWHYSFALLVLSLGQVLGTALFFK